MVTLGVVPGVIFLTCVVHHPSLRPIHNFREGGLRYRPRKAVPVGDSWGQGHPSTKTFKIEVLRNAVSNIQGPSQLVLLYHFFFKFITPPPKIQPSVS